MTENIFINIQPLGLHVGYEKTEDLYVINNVQSVYIPSELILEVNYRTEFVRVKLHICNREELLALLRVVTV
jgi:hypothetical protein